MLGKELVYGQHWTDEDDVYILYPTNEEGALNCFYFCIKGKYSELSVYSSEMVFVFENKKLKRIYY